MRIATFLVASLLFSGGHAFAQGVNPLSPLPPAGFQFTGSWDCEGSFRNKQLHKSSFTGAVILDGKWIELTEQDVQPATGYVAKYLIGYDSAGKKLVEFDANNFGAAVYFQHGRLEGQRAHDDFRCHGGPRGAVRSQPIHLLHRGKGQLHGGLADQQKGHNRLDSVGSPRVQSKIEWLNDAANRVLMRA